MAPATRQLRRVAIASIAAWYSVVRCVRYLWRAERSSGQLHCVQDRTDAIAPDDVLLFCTLRNEAQRIDHFLAHYRTLGVQHFIFIDNESTDGFQQRVEREGDVTVFHTSASYKEAEFGIQWLNLLLRRYGSGHWCVTVDADELLVLPGESDGALARVTTRMAAEGQRSLFAVLVDLYGQGPVQDASYVAGADPFSVTRYFDESGYLYEYLWRHNAVFVKGGVRQRTLYPADHANAPPLNKIPLVRWRWYFVYYASMHLAAPLSLNAAFRYSMSAALLHFKFFAGFEAKVREELKRRQHADDAELYERYQTYLNGCSPYEAGVSVPYAGFDQLTELGLARAGRGGKGKRTYVTSRPT